ncbi:MAG: FtsX-like permease family protein, partial [Solirubrobacterales bacterium]
LVIGVLASGVGLLAGLGFVKLILALFELGGFELPQSGTPISGTTVVLALIVGVVATVVSATIPAVRATRVTPLEALTEDVGIERATPTRRRTAIALTLGLAGVAIILTGLFAVPDFTSALSIMGLGLVLLFISIAMLGGRIVAPLAAVVGGPIERLRGAPGKLARQNVLRNPSRTATTSSALMIGVALVVFVLTLGTALTKSIENALEESFVGDLAVFNVDGFSPISKRVSPAIADVEGVAVSSALGASGGVIDGDDELINGLEPETLPEAVNIDWVVGSDETLAEFGSKGAIAEEEWASENGVEVGDEVEITTPGGDVVTVAVEGLVRDRIALLVDSVAVPLELLRDRFDARGDFGAIATFEEGAPFEPTRGRVDELLTDRFPQAEARSQKELREENREQLNQILFLIYALLTLSVLLSLIGVVNTLVLTIYERTREIGMLRAIGASKGQMRMMVRYESLITAMIGAVIGVVIGLAVAVAAVEALEGEGLILAIPVVGTIVVLVLSAVAGVLAGILPASRAAKVDVMEALHYE